LSDEKEEKEGLLDIGMIFAVGCVQDILPSYRTV
jgi:hypothetical protein